MATSVGAVVLPKDNMKNEQGFDKLLPVRQRSDIRECVKNILESGINDIAVVINPDQYDIGAALAGQPVTIVVNQEPGPDSRQIVELGIKALPGYVTGVIISKCRPQPISSNNFAVLANLHHRAPQYAVIPGRDYQDSSPALFPVANYPTRIEEAMPQNRRLWRKVYAAG